MRGSERMTLSKSKIVLIALIVVLTIALSAVGCIMQTSAPQNIDTPQTTQRVEVNERFAEGVTVNGISVAGLDMAGAKKLFESEKSDLPPSITIVAGEKSAAIETSGVLITRDTDEVLSKALAVKDDEPKAFTTTSAYDITPLMDRITEIATELATEPVNASAVYNDQNPEKFDYTEGVDGIAIDPQTLFDDLQRHVDDGAAAPLNAVTTEVPPAVTSEMVKQNTTLFSSAFTSFAKSPYYAKSRVTNIKMAAEIINGTVLAPGEEFSFNDVVGPRTAAGGWQAAGAINDGVSVQEVGGGICQVSSTLFNTVLKGDLEVVKRSPHSWPLSYVTTGQDATVSMGGPDFVFKNNRETPVIIVTNVDEEKKTITIDFYGEPLKDGMRIELESNKISTVAKPKTQVTLNPKMAPGTSNTLRDGRGGSKHETYKLYYKGDELVERVFSHGTSYRAIAGKVEVGPELATTPPDSSGGGNEDDFDIPDESQDVGIPDENDVIILD